MSCLEEGRARRGRLTQQCRQRFFRTNSIVVHAQGIFFSPGATSIAIGFDKNKNGKKKRCFFLYMRCFFLCFIISSSSAFVLCSDPVKPEHRSLIIFRLPFCFFPPFHPIPVEPGRKVETRGPVEMKQNCLITHHFSRRFESPGKKKYIILHTFVEGGG
jgi:hypothetical protein